jgi:hypothetical protein
MAQIEPVSFPIVGEAVTLEVTVGGFKTDANTAGTYYELKKADGTNCIVGNYQLTEAQFNAWGEDNSVVDGYVADHLGLVLVPPSA